MSDKIRILVDNEIIEPTGALLEKIIKSGEELKATTESIESERLNRLQNMAKTKEKLAALGLDENDLKALGL